MRLFPCCANATPMERDLAITFAGGGSRTFYQIGLFERWSEHVLPRTGAMAGCSAGAAMATLLLSGRLDETKAFFAEQRRGVRGLVNWELLRQRQRPFPHDGIYRRTLRHSLEDGGFERIKASPFPLFIIASAFPRLMPSAVGIALGLGVYQLEKRLRPMSLHPTLPQRVGFIPHVRDARSCESPEELVELILSSSSTPPFTKRGRHGGRLLLDGSLIDNAPAHLPETVEGITKNLVLLTRPYPEGATGRRDHRLYIAPSQKLPIERWDYRESAPVEETLEVGRIDGERHLASLRDFIAN